MKKYFLIALTATLALSAISAAAQSAEEETAAAGNAPAVSEKSDKEIAAMKRLSEKAVKEIDRRNASLATLSQRVQSMKKVSSSEQTELIARIQKEQTDLAALKSDIAAETDLAALREKVKSISQSYRIYALILPQIQVLAAADRMNTIIASLSAIGVKLDARISQASASGEDVSAIQKLRDEMNAKLDDAKKQTEAARTHVISLAPDNGDKDAAKKNASELKTARADIKIAHEDFVDASRAAKDIMKALKELGLAKSASLNLATTSPSAD